MRNLIVSALFAASVVVASPSIAQTAPAQAAPAQTAPAPTASTPTAGFSADTPIVDIVADPSAYAVLTKTLPNLTSHEAYEQFKIMSLRQLQPFSDGRITDEMISTIDAGLKALPKK